MRKILVDMMAAASVSDGAVVAAQRETAEQDDIAFSGALGVNYV